MKEAKSISQSELKSLILNGQKTLVIDVRNPEEYQTQHLPRQSICRSNSWKTGSWILKKMSLLLPFVAKVAEDQRMRQNSFNRITVMRSFFWKAEHSGGLMSRGHLSLATGFERSHIVWQPQAPQRLYLPTL